MRSHVKIIAVVPTKKISWHLHLLALIEKLDHVKLQIIEVDTNTKFNPSILCRFHRWFDSLISPGQNPSPISKISPIEELGICDYVLSFVDYPPVKYFKEKIRSGTLCVKHANEESQYYSPGIWEFAHEISELKTMLQFEPAICIEECQAYVSTQKTDQLSLRKNEQKFCTRAMLMLERFLFERSELSSSVYESSESRLKHQQKKALSISSFSFHIQAILDNIKEKLVYRDGWFIQISNKLNNGLMYLTPPKDRFWADPFPIEHEEKLYIFVEEWVYKEPHAHLTALELDPSHKVVSQHTVMKTDFHLSYPNVFEHKGRVYMVPESKNDKKISLYRCDRFPDKWVLEKVLMDDIFAVDTTLVWHKDKWWMFTNIDRKDGEQAINDELYIFYSDTLFSSNWKPHARNPIKSGVIGSRSAGKVFEKNGILMRPAQDGSKRYGYGILIYKILALSTTEYEEELDQEIYPDEPNGILRTHTYNTLEDLIVTDRFAFKSKY